MAARLLFFVLSILCVSCVLGQSCYPASSSRQNCRSDGIEGWTYWSNMQYKYIPKRLSQADAVKACRPWSGKICSGRRFRSDLASYAAKGENELAILAAYREAPVSTDDVFWIGVKDTPRGNLRYTDNTRSKLNTFSGGIPKLEKGQCVAVSGQTGRMEVRPCSESHAFVCKVQPSGH